MWFVYILLCQDTSLYTGISPDVERRFILHKNGKGGAYTRSHKPIKIVFCEPQQTKSDALKREHEIKSWKRTQKIETLKLTL